MVLLAPVETIDFGTLTAAQARGIAELVNKVWPKPGVTVEDRARRLLSIAQGHEGPEALAARSFVVFEMGRVLAHAAVMPRTIGTDAGAVAIGALLLVCSDPHQRGRGLGETVARAAFSLVDEGQYPWILFQTKEKVRPFYEKLGCTLVENRIVNSRGENPESNPFWDEIVMRYPAQGDWPAGTIDLRGPGY